jgi:hypothetical protein
LELERARAYLCIKLIFKERKGENQCCPIGIHMPIDQSTGKSTSLL